MESQYPTQEVNEASDLTQLPLKNIPTQLRVLGNEVYNQLFDPTHLEQSRHTIINIINTLISKIQMYSATSAFMLLTHCVLGRIDSVLMTRIVPHEIATNQAVHAKRGELEQVRSHGSLYRVRSPV